MRDRKESITRLEGGRRKLAFNLSVTHQDINGSGQNAVRPVKGVGNYLMMEGFNLVLHGGTLDLGALGR